MKRSIKFRLIISSLVLFVAALGVNVFLNSSYNLSTEEELRKTLTLRAATNKTSELMIKRILIERFIFFLSLFNFRRFDK